MKKIDVSTPMYPNAITFVDDEDYDRLSQHNWYVSGKAELLYAIRQRRDPSIKNPRGQSKQVTILMHREIMNAPDGYMVDHKNMDTLYNLKSNLRICTHAQNARNQKISSRNTSGFKGVSWDRLHKKWRAGICYGNEIIFLSYHTCLIKAARAYDTKAKELFGEFARLNFPEHGTGLDTERKEQ